MRSAVASAVLAPCAVGLAACAVSTTQQAYTQPLIQQVGAGSTTVATVVPSLQADARAAGVFSDPSLQQPVTYLARGQLSKLSPQDLFRLAMANHNAQTHVGGFITKLDQLAASITAATISLSSYPGLPDGSKGFISRWNQFLQSTAGDLRAVSASLASLGPAYGEFRSLLRAAFDTASLHSVVQFDKVRRRVLNDLARRSAGMQQAVQAFGSNPSERQLVNFVNGSQQAEAIVTKVNQEYPHGSLAQEFKTH